MKTLKQNAVGSLVSECKAEKHNQEIRVRKVHRDNSQISGSINKSKGLLLGKLTHTPIRKTHHHIEASTFLSMLRSSFFLH
jgi:hypothetical protein